MIHFELSPVDGFPEYTLKVKGFIVYIDGEAYDFTPLPDGGRLPIGSVSNDAICGVVRREGDVLTVPIIYPFTAAPNMGFVDPKPITVRSNGPVKFPSLEDVT